MTDAADAAREPQEQCGALLGQTRFLCDREPGHLGQHRTYLETVDKVVFYGGDLKAPGQRRLCKACFGGIDEEGFSVHGGKDIADRLRSARRSQR